MHGMTTFIRTLLAMAAMLSVSAWSGAAASCRVDAAAIGNMAKHAARAFPDNSCDQHRQHRAAIAGRKAPAPAGPRLDCAACVGILTPFPSMERQELMPFVPFAQSFEPPSGIRPSIDPPPPRGA